MNLPNTLITFKTASIELTSDERYSYWKRRWINRIMCGGLILSGVLAVAPLIGIFAYISTRGLPELTWDFFTQLPKPVGELGGGMANALMGTGILVAAACLVAVPWGIAIGTYLSEYGRGKIATIVRLSVDLLASIPSIIVGLFVYSIVVLPMKRFSAIAGAIALAILMIPTVARTSEELLKMVPQHIREAGLALGIPRWKVINRIVVRGMMGAMSTGVMLSVARVAGETAPLLFTAFGSRYWNTGLDQPIASLPVQIFNYALSPFEDWNRQAWAAALVLVLFVFLINAITRLALRKVGRIGDM